MRTTMKNYNMKLRLFKCEKRNGVRIFEKLSEIDFASEQFESKSKVFENYFNEVSHLIDSKIKAVNWIKGDTWHDDMLY